MSAVPAPTPVPSTPAPRRRRRRWLRRTVWTLLVLLGALVAVVVVVAHSLDRPWLKGRLQRLAHDNGLDVDWRETRVGLFSGIDIEDLVVQSPPAFRADAPELLRIGRIEARWSPGTLAGAGPKLTRVHIHDVQLSVVQDSERGLSLAALGPPPTSDQKPPPPPSPPTPLSRLLAEILHAPPPVADVELGKVVVTLLRTGPQRTPERFKLEGFELRARVDRAHEGWRITLGLGNQATPLALTLTRDDQAARARLFLSAQATPAGLDAAIDLALPKQAPLKPFEALFALEKVLHLEAQARVDHKRHLLRVTLSSLEAADGAAKVSAALELPDKGDPLVESAKADLDVARLLAAAPPGLVPLTVKKGTLTVRAEQLPLSGGAATAPLGTAGTAHVDGKLDGVAFRQPRTEITLGRVEVGLSAKAGGQGLATRGTVGLATVHGVLGPRRIDSDKLTVELDGDLSPQRAFTGRVHLRAPTLDDAGAERASVRDLALTAHARAVHADPAAPFGVAGKVDLETTVGALDFTQPGALHATAQQITLGARLPLTAPPIELDLAAPTLTLTDGAGRPLPGGPLKLAARLQEIALDGAHLARSRAKGSLDLEIPAVHAVVAATKHADAVDYDVTVTAKTLADARPFLPPKTVLDVPWDKVGVSLHSVGRVDRFSPPELRHQTELRLDHPAFTQRKRTVSADQIGIILASKGGLLRHAGDATLTLKNLIAGATKLGDGKITLSVGLDAPAPSLALRIGAEGAAAPTIGLRATLGFDPKRRAVTFDVDGNLSHLAPLAPVLEAIKGLDGFDLDPLALELKTKGALTGVVQAVSKSGVPTLAPDPLRTAAGEATLGFRAREVAWSTAEQGIESPSIAWSGQLKTEGDTRTLKGDLQIEKLHVDLGAHELALEGLSDALDLTLAGDLRRGDLTLKDTLALKSLTQDYAPAYPTGDLGLELETRRDKDGVIRVTTLRLDNKKGGTLLTLKGALELAAERRSVGIRAELRQDLAKAWAAPATYRGQGTLAATIRLGSGNLRVFRTGGSVRLSGVSVALPKANVEAQGVEGEIPFAAELAVGRRGIHFLRELELNPYSERRFVDQHPLMSHHSFLSVQKLVTPYATVAPLAGNLKIEQNIFQLNQLEMGLRGGKVTGQAALDWSGDDTTLSLNVRASHVLSSHDEPFDGHAALQLSAGERSLDGRAEILRIGRRHLLDLLDVVDPHRIDPAMNRVRRTLALGYPDRLRIVFDHGFAAAKITFGGLARLISLDEMRGIPMGPLIDKLLAPLDALKGDDDE